MRPCENVVPCLMPSSMQTKYASAGEQRVNAIQQRRDEQERELDRLGDAGQERRQRRRDHDAADPACGSPAAPCCHIASAAAGSPHILNRYPPARLPAVGSPAVKRLISPRITLPVAGSTYGPDLEEERHVPDVMQAERNQRPLDDAVERERGRRVARRRPVRERVDPAPDRRPDEAEHDAERRWRQTP